MTVYAVLLAGGSGERLWPLSTPRKPKQFVDLIGGKPLLAQAVARLKGFVPLARTLVVTARELVPITRRTLPELPRANILGEPCRRNTAAAVAWATAEVRRRAGADAVLCILTADQVITPAAAFRATLRRAVSLARREPAVVTIGITPTCAATGFGYIRVEGASATFVEKPDAKTAARFVKSGRYVWNSGMFIFRASVLEAAFAAHAPAYLALLRTRTVARVYPKLPTLSIDYAVMEKIHNLRVVPASFTWDDVGSWLALEKYFPSDRAGNTVLGASAHVLKGTGNFVLPRGRRPLGVIGLNDVLVIETPTATLVCAKDSVSELRALVKSFRS